MGKLIKKKQNRILAMIAIVAVLVLVFAYYEGFIGPFSTEVTDGTGNNPLDVQKTYITKYKTFAGSSNDAHLYKVSNGMTDWTVPWLATSGTVVSSGNYITVRVGDYIKSEHEYYDFYRGVFMFNTGTLTSSMIIDSATLKFYCTSTCGKTIQWQKASGMSYPPVAADYNKAKFTGSYGTVTPTVGWQTVSIGTGAIVKAGITKIGARFYPDDINGPEPFPGIFSTSFYSGNTATYKPVLTVYYHLGGASET
jgi:hypothetical protein